MALLQNSSHRESVFASVFPVSSVVHTTPTPGATPEVGFPTPSQPFGNTSTSTVVKAVGVSHGNLTSPNALSTQHPKAQAQEDIDQIAAQIVKRDAAWSTATRFLTFPREKPQRTRDVTEALVYLLAASRSDSGDNGFNTGREQGTEHDLIEWYVAEVRRDYKDARSKNVTALWGATIQCDLAAQTLEQSIVYMQSLQREYFQPIAEDILPVIQTLSEPSNQNTRTWTTAEGTIEKLTGQLKRDIQGMMIHSLPLHLLSSTLSFFLFDRACKLFDIDVVAEDDDKKNPISRNHAVELQSQLHAICTGLRNIGYPQARAERAFADAVDKIIDRYIASQYMRVDWQGRSTVTTRLRAWIADGLAPFAETVLKFFSTTRSPERYTPISGVQLEPYQIDMWKQLAVWRLGKARVNGLFDFILKWDQSLGAVRDLKEFVVTPTARSYLVQSITLQLSRRLLQPAVPTLDILNVYIYSIRLFNELDPKGVLLDRVSKPLRRYLKERSDTARIIITSFLTDVEDVEISKVHSLGEISKEIALEMSQPALPNLHEFDHDLDWADMNWSPEPVDAEPEYRKSKSDDVTASLLSLYEREDFIAELKNIFGEHLLSTVSSNYEKETHLLDLIKGRLGDDKLQACEVMLRDIVDSNIINTEVARHLPDGEEEVFHSDLLVQILSRFFWPALHEESFLIPKPVSRQLREFTEAYKAMKKLRGLEFLPALGRVTVDLELEDRSVEVEVLPAQASIIYAFEDKDVDNAFQSITGETADTEAAAAGTNDRQPENQKSTNTVARPIRRSVQYLIDTLQMDESLVRTSLAFWVGKMVLKEVDTNVFQVMERLEYSQSERGGVASSDAAAATAAAAAEASAVAATAASASAVKSQEDVLLENMALYSQFVLGMLTNQGSMPLAKIVMTLKMVMGGGFPYGPDEIKVLLQRLVDEEKLVNSGDVYGIAKTGA